MAGGNGQKTDIEWLKKGFRDLNKKVDDGFQETRNNFHELRDLYVDTFETKSDAKEKFDSLEEKKVSRDEFRPVKIIAYGLVGIILIAVVGAMLSETIGI